MSDVVVVLEVIDVMVKIREMNWGNQGIGGQRK